MPREYIVVYEEPVSDDPVDDELVLDLDVEGREDMPTGVEADFGAVVTNEASPLAVIGLIMTIIGAIVGWVAAWMFAAAYPAEFPGGADYDEGGLKLMAGLMVAMGALLVGGTLLVGFGRSLRARGILHSLRFTQR